MTKYIKRMVVDAVQFDGTFESLQALSNMTTVKILLWNGAVANVDVYVAPTSDVDDGYRTIRRSEWLVSERDKTLSIWEDKLFRQSFQGVV